MMIVGTTFGAEADEVLLGSRDVPAKAIQAGLAALINDLRTILQNVTHELGNGRLAYVDVCVGIGVDGTVGILGIGATAKANGGLTLRIEFDKV